MDKWRNCLKIVYIVWFGANEGSLSWCICVRGCSAQCWAVLFSAQMTSIPWPFVLAATWNGNLCYLVICTVSVYAKILWVSLVYGYHVLHVTMRWAFLLDCICDFYNNRYKARGQLCFLLMVTCYYQWHIWHKQEQIKFYQILNVDIH